MFRSEARTGMKVKFGRPNGEKTLAEILKLNIKTAKVRTLETRGLYNAKDAGRVWVVPYDLMEPAEGAVVETAKPKRTEKEIILEILGVYAALSPENLHADGERPTREIAPLRAKLNAKLLTLFNEIGRVVDESEAYDYARRT